MRMERNGREGIEMGDNEDMVEGRERCQQEQERSIG